MSKNDPKVSLEPLKTLRDFQKPLHNQTWVKEKTRVKYNLKACEKWKKKGHRLIRKAKKG